MKSKEILVKRDVKEQIMKDLKKPFFKKKMGKIDTHLGWKCLKKCKEIISMKTTRVVTFTKERRDVIEIANVENF